MIQDSFRGLQGTGHSAIITMAGAPKPRIFTMIEKLLERIENRTYVVGIYGLGYVGLPLALAFNEAGFKTLGFDIDPTKIESIEAGKSYIKHIDGNRIKASVDKGLLEATVDFSRTGEADALILCVPTPLGVHLEPDLKFITDTMDALLPYVRAGHMLCLESTTYPGTTQETMVTPILEKGFKLGKDIFVAYSPEREDPGNPNFETKTIPKIVAGCTPSCLKLASALYKTSISSICEVSSPEVAETAKVLENIFRAVNIGLVNELKVVTDRMNIDIWEVIRAASTKPFGFMPFYPGPGLGGHCIPIDPFYLSWKAKEFGVNARFIELAGEVNRLMPEFVVSKVIEGLNGHSKSVRNSKILIIGLAYKKNVDDSRESPSFEIIHLLKQMGADVNYYDPYIPRMPKKRDFSFEGESIPFEPNSIAQYDCVVISSDHDSIDYEILQKASQLIIDTRGRYKRGTPKVVSA